MVLVGAACLLASGAVVAPDIQQAAASSAVILCAIVADVAFLALSPKAPHVLLPALYLCCVGVAVSFDTAPSLAAHHVLFAIVGMIACIMLCCLARLTDNCIAVASPMLLFLTVVLCAAPLIPGIGVEANGAKSWVMVGPTVLQPSELAKVTLALSLSTYLAVNSWRLCHFSLRGILPISFVFGLALFLEVAENDLGTGLVLFSLFASMLSMCSKRAGVAYAAILSVCVVALVIVAALVSPHILARFVAWRDPYADPQGAGYQRIMAINAMANGGLVGTGLHFGPMLSSVPEVHSDYVFAAVVEELGVVGGSLIALAICCLAATAARSALALHEGSFERNVLLGGGSLLFCQSFVIIGGVTGVIPLTGVTLPFVSYGGSSMLSSFALAGLMGGCASSQKAEAHDWSGSLVVLPSASCVAMSLCIAATLGLQGGLLVCGVTLRDISSGKIQTADGVTLAVSDSDSATGRSYPQGSLASHIVGEASSGIEGRVIEAVVGNPSSMQNVLALHEVAGDTILTIDSSVQLEAERQLEGMTGAIVSMDTSTGAVIAMASAPTYDVSQGYDPDAGDGISYLNRATDVLYAPGSTFKVVTMATALEGGYATGESVYTGDPLVLSSGDVVINFRDASYGAISLTEALRVSSNTAFAELGLQIGSSSIEEMARMLGFGGSLGTTDIDVAVSTYATPTNEYGLAWSSVGQPVWVDGSEQGPNATVLQMCSIMATVANGGMRNVPYLVESGPIAKLRNEGVRALSPSTSDQLWEMMLASGTTLQGVRVAGKTGTAQVGMGTLCWYICSAEGVSVACCIESDEGRTGSELAQPRALSVLAKAIEARYAKS